MNFPPNVRTFLTVPCSNVKSKSTILQISTRLHIPLRDAEKVLKVFCGDFRRAIIEISLAQISSQQGQALLVIEWKVTTIYLVDKCEVIWEKWTSINFRVVILLRKIGIGPPQKRYSKLCVRRGGLTKEVRLILQSADFFTNDQENAKSRMFSKLYGELCRSSKENE